jgi:hypothetical protein
MRRFDDEDLTGAQFRECDLSRARLVGVVMQDVKIDGSVTNLVVNGVEVMSYVEAELDRRHPVRLLMRSDEPAELREAWRQLRKAPSRSSINNSWITRRAIRQPTSITSEGRATIAQVSMVASGTRHRLQPSHGLPPGSPDHPVHAATVLTPPTRGGKPYGAGADQRVGSRQSRTFAG